MKQQHINEIKGVVILAVGMIVLAGLLSFDPLDLPWYTSHPNLQTQNWVKDVGAYGAGALLFVFGYGAYLIAAFLFFWSWNKFLSRV